MMKLGGDIFDYSSMKMEGWIKKWLEKKNW